MTRGYEVINNIIIVNRDLTELDIFLRDFLNILEKHSDYLVVSGFVSIATGRTRGTEDIDVLVPVMKKEKFERFFNELNEKRFWCYQGDRINETRKAKYFEFTHPQKIKIKDFEFKIPPIEFEILYKEIILKGKKDIEDARHLRIFFSDIVNNKKFEEYEKIIRGELKK